MARNIFPSHSQRDSLGSNSPVSRTGELSDESADVMSLPGQFWYAGWRLFAVMPAVMGEG